MPPALALPQVLGDPVVLISAAAAAVAVGALLVVFLRGRKRQAAPRTLREKVRAAAGRAWEGDIDPMLLWLPPEQQHGDRRKAARRGDRLTSIRVAGAPRGDGQTADEGLVTDRSSRGLCFASDRRYEAGEGRFVRAEGAPEGTPWVAVTIRNCRDVDDYFLIGCEFREELPWGVLLLFG
jgi:hypothetical protein